MEKFLQEVSTLYWWISVFIVGLFLNLLAAYLKQPLDQLLAKHDASRRNRNEIAKAKFVSSVAELVRTPILLQLESTFEVRCRVRIVFFFLASCVFLAFAIFMNTWNPLKSLDFGFVGVIVRIASLVSMFWAFGLLNLVRDCRRLVDAANVQIAEIEAKKYEGASASFVRERRSFQE